MAQRWVYYDIYMYINIDNYVIMSDVIYLIMLINGGNIIYNVEIVTNILLYCWKFNF